MYSINEDINEVGSAVLRVAEKEVINAGFDKLNWAILKNEKAINNIDEKIGEVLDELIFKAKEDLINPEKGLAVIDIPSIDGADCLEDMWLGSLIALIVSKRIYSIRNDPNTGLPFTIYNASSAGEALLKKNGIKYFSPEKNLGFHTDGIVSQNSLWSPNFVSIYNVYLGYKKPGNFYWVPFALWDEFKEWQNKLGSKRFKLEITPITYKGLNDELKITSNGDFEVELMRAKGDGFIPFFNGEVMACVSDPAFEMQGVKQMLESLSCNKTRISTPLRSRRLFILNNWLGAHARDIFEEPLEGVKYTRSFFRIMSSEMACA